MASFQVNKTIQEINEKIKQGKAVVLTAEEMIEVVRKKGEVAAAREVQASGLTADSAARAAQHRLEETHASRLKPVFNLTGTLQSLF